MDSFTLDLPIPHKMLHPNSKVFSLRAAYARSARVKEYRQAVRLLAEVALNRRDPPRWKEAVAQAVFRYPDPGRRRDRGNLFGWLKAGFDGLQDAGIIEDDSGLVHQPVRIEKADSPHVVITITPIGVPCHA